MKHIVRSAAVLAAFLLAGCTADLQRAKDLTVGDGLQYVEDNHEFRRDIRGDYQQIVKSISEKCKAAAAGETEVSEAIEKTAVCFEFLDRHYPGLATLELVREAAESVNELVPVVQGIGAE